MAPEAKIRAMLVDDESLARDILREYLAAHADIEVVAECANGFEAVKAVTDHSPDLLFLDIQMPKLDGFEVLELLDRDVAVVFVTAYDEYALKAFEIHAVDYLLKPFSPERFAEALVHARERIAARAQSASAQAGAAHRPAVPTASSAASVSASELANDARPPGRWLERILVRDQSRVQVIPIAKLDHAEAQDDYVSLHAEGKTHLKPMTLAELERALDPARFVRIHRSHILNVERLERLELYAKDSRMAILKDGRELPVSRSGYARLKELL